VSTPFKIRLFSFLLTLCLAVTAIIAHYSFHKEDTFNADAEKIERNLHKKEAYIKEFLNNSANFKRLQTIDKDPEYATELIQDLGTKRSIYLYTYSSSKLIFWGDNRIILEDDVALREGSNMIKWKNGWYEAIKRSSGHFSAVCFIPVRSDYLYENQYLKDVFDGDIISSDNLEIAALNSGNVHTIRNIDGKYLFSVQLKPSAVTIFYPELILWILTVISACILMNIICTWIAFKGYINTAISLFLLFFLVLRIIDLKTNWLATHFHASIFEPWGNSTNFTTSSIGSLLLNAVAALWFLAFTYSFRSKIKLPAVLLNRPGSYILFIFMISIISLGIFRGNAVFYNLIIHSTINFDLTNILNLGWTSWLGILALCFSLLNAYLLLEILLSVSAKLLLTNQQRLLIFIATIIVVLISRFYLNDPAWLFLIIALIIFFRGRMVYQTRKGFSLSVLVIVLLTFSVIISVKLSIFHIQKELEQRKSMVRGLESANDPYAVLLFSDLEQKIIKDDFIINAFINGNNDKRPLNNYLQKFYFNGYLSKYNFTIFEYGSKNLPEEKSNKSIEDYAGLIASGSSKITQYFYKNNNTFGFQNYFSLLPITLNNKVLGTLVIELKSKNILDSYSFFPVLAGSKVKPDNKLVNYSFAYYNNGHLVSQYGDYIYDLVSDDFKSAKARYVFIENDDFSHLIYKIDANRMIIISKPVVNWFTHLASVSFLFLVLLLFATLVIAVHWIASMFYNKDAKMYNFSWNYVLSKNHILYRTRIQVSMVFAIVITLIIVGTITYVSISYQYRERQKDILLEHITQIDAGIESQMFQNDILRYNEQMLNAFTSINATELNLYDSNGGLIFTTQPKIYDNGVRADRMNALAYVYLNKYQRSQYISNEDMGNMEYISAYKPIRNSRNETVAYLNLPDFTNATEFQERIGTFLNTLINVYALIFVAIGLFAVFLANKITYPLAMVQKSLSETKVGRKNDPILWERDDEIGNLIKEYNKMILALDESTQRFARSERETAWKEMAKQVAHEIKNPLTPLKLGVQLLEKSWREKDPNFDKKFEKFTKSFVEQIESLSHIASEFSNFAKMPDTLLENVNLSEIIEQSIEVFQQMAHVNIILKNDTKANTLVKGDRDQLLRSFNNLIKNAVEAIPEDMAGNIEIALKVQDARVHVQVADNGKGIPKALHERIFNPNFTTKSSGTGLGLAFVKQAIENMNGSIRFETEDEKGTVFYITIPLAIS
jgi:two-component system nitrogen regulation sensor histidine kinase NtrY